ncbi:Uncharacterised protein [Candidatus Tiddalikarchaeum anstoanum]|nr:Uncharacterised protein [Candidatus Tiddalikarchaeum anstoanum]
MKMTIAMIVLLVILAGCTVNINNSSGDCQSYCQDQPHIQCVGSWNITGSYPNCTCSFKCSTESLGSLGALPNISDNMINDLGNLPPVNISIDISSGLTGNPFPTEPNMSAQ